jgi:hypothetical protein
MQKIQFAAIMNLIQSKQMKDISNNWNSKNPESQSSAEWQWMWEKNWKMHEIQFAVIMNLLQSKQMKVIHNNRNRKNPESRPCAESKPNRFACRLVMWISSRWTCFQYKWYRLVLNHSYGWWKTIFSVTRVKLCFSRWIIMNRWDSVRESR